MLKGSSGYISVEPAEKSIVCDSRGLGTMKQRYIVLALVGLARPLPSQPPSPHHWSSVGCTSAGCHEGIEPIRQLDTGMMKQILTLGRAVNDADGCTVCHV